MTKKSLLILTGFMVAAGAAAAVAAVGSDPGGSWRHGKHHMHGLGGGMHELRLKALDTDKDGDVTLAEFLKPGEQRFAELDKDNAAVIDQAKLTAAFKARTEQKVDRMLQRLDRDGDGKASLAEFLEGSRLDRGRGHGGRGHGRHHGRWRHGAVDQGGADKAASENRASADKPAETATVEDGRTFSGEGERGWRGKHGGRDGWRGEHREGRGWGRHGGGMEHRIARFKALDKNGDGFIDKSELQSAADEQVAYQVKRMMHLHDVDKNGKISREEFLAPAKQRFARMDLNDDGKIAADDLPPNRRLNWLAK